MTRPLLRPDATRRRLLGCVAAALVAVGTVVLAPVASAHTSLVGSEPAAGATVDVPPDQVALTFSDEIAAQFVRVALSVDGGEPVEVPTATDGSEVVADLPDRQAPTSTQGWQVSYRVVSADGHPVSGSLDLTVAPDPAESAGATSSPEGSATGAATSRPTAPPSQDQVADADVPVADDDGLVHWWPATIAVVAVLALTGTVVGAALLGRRRRQSSP